MRQVYRYEHNLDYWNRRWQQAGQDADRFENLDIYPVRYAERFIQQLNTQAPKILEVGCGLGRVFKHFYSKGYDIHGIERSEVAVKRLHAENARYPVSLADVRQLSFPDAGFDAVMAFGVYHNLDNGLEQALSETSRVLKPGGGFCISMRPDNLEMRLNEMYWRFKNRKAYGGTKQFHKLLVGETEFKSLLQKHHLHTTQIFRARNVSSLYRIPWLRMGRDLIACETQQRSSGYQLNWLGEMCDRALTRFFPFHSCNVLVYMGEKKP